MIKNIGLANFKCFEKLSLPLNSLNLLAGVNGTGKSTIIQSLLLLRQSFLQGYIPGKSLSLNADLVEIGTSKDALYEDALEDKITFSLTWSKKRKNTWIFKYDRDYNDLNIEKEVLAENWAKESLFDNNFQYLCAERIGPRTSKKMLPPALIFACSGAKCS